MPHKRTIMTQLSMVGFLTAMLAVLAGLANGQETSTTKPAYPTKFDYLNINTLLFNKRLLKSFYRCLVDEGPCTQEGTVLKRVIPDALKTQCRKCTIYQKRNGQRAIDFVMKNKPEMWQGILRKFDPSETLFNRMLSDPEYLKGL